MRDTKREITKNPWGRFPKWLTEKKIAKGLGGAEGWVVAWFVCRSQFGIMKIKMKPSAVAEDLGYTPRAVYKAIRELLKHKILVQVVGKRWMYRLNYDDPGIPFNGPKNTEKQKEDTTTLRHRHSSRTDDNIGTRVPIFVNQSSETN